MVPKYVNLARERIEAELAGTLRTRPMHKPVYDPVEAGNSLTIAPWTPKADAAQMVLLEKQRKRERYAAR